MEFHDFVNKLDALRRLNIQVPSLFLENAPVDVEFMPTQNDILRIIKYAEIIFEVEKKSPEQVLKTVQEIASKNFDNSGKKYTLVGISREEGHFMNAELGYADIADLDGVTKTFGLQAESWEYNGSRSIVGSARVTLISNKLSNKEHSFCMVPSMICTFISHDGETYVVFTKKACTLDEAFSSENREKECEEELKDAFNSPNAVKDRFEYIARMAGQRTIFGTNRVVATLGNVKDLLRINKFPADDYSTCLFKELALINNLSV
jgi:hypothetical protein